MEVREIGRVNETVPAMLENNWPDSRAQLALFPEGTRPLPAGGAPRRVTKLVTF